MYDKGPAHHLCSDIEELGDDALTIVLYAQQFSERLSQWLSAVGVAVLRHLCHSYQHQQQDDNCTDEDVRLDEHGKVVRLHQFELCIGQRVACGGVHRAHLCLYALHGHIKSCKTTHRIECLGEVKALSGCILTSHTVDERVAAGLEKRQSAGHDKISEEERIIDTHLLGGDE